MLTEEIRRDGAPIGPEATCAEARLVIADYAPAIAIVDRNEKPIGLVSRAALFAANPDRPITALADSAPLIIDASADIAEVEARLLGHPHALGAGFIIVEAGRYAAIGDAVATLRQAAQTRARALHCQNVALHSGDATIWAIDYAGRRLIGAERIAELFGWPITFSDFAREWRFVPASHRESFQAAMEAARKDGRFHFQHTLLKPDGARVCFEHCAHVTFDETGAPLAAHFLSSDISHRFSAISAMESVIEQIGAIDEDDKSTIEAMNSRLAEHGLLTPQMMLQRSLQRLTNALRHLEQRNELLVAAMAEAERANAAKTQFLANVSHELRTPLNAILGYSEILEEDLSAANLETPAQDAQRIRGAARHLLHLINGLLDLSKVEAGKMDVNVETFDLRDALSRTIDTIRPLAHKSGNSIEVELADDLGQADTDHVKLNQCLLNLLSNACKFTKGGQVSLSAHRDGDRLVFEVADTGIGMTNAQAEQIFKPFMQADGLTTHRFGGTGLGLAITREMARLLGGDVSVITAPGRGSTFRLTALAQLGRPMAAAQAAATEKDHDRLLALVVDADPSVQETARRGMSRLGFGVRGASSTEAALTIMRERRPSIVVLGAAELGAPDLTLLEQIKTDPALRDTPVIVLGAPAGRERAITLGACEHIPKPIDHEALAAAAVRYADFNPIVGISSATAARAANAA